MVLKNLRSVFTNSYPNYSSESESKSESEIVWPEENIAERTRLRRQRFNETAERAKTINSKLFRTSTRTKNINTKSNAQQITNFFSPIKSRK